MLSSVRQGQSDCCPLRIIFVVISALCVLQAACLVGRPMTTRQGLGQRLDCFAAEVALVTCVEMES